MQKTAIDIIPDSEIERVHGNANFGGMSKREVVNEGILKYAFGYSAGHTQLTILLEHGLLRKPKPGRYFTTLTKKGLRYLRSAYLAESLDKCRQAILAGTFQGRVLPWMLECFGEDVTMHKRERNERFCEEALEAVQAFGMPKADVLKLVDYVFDRPAGEQTQEVGGVMVTLAALCLASGMDMHACGEAELTRVKRPEIIEKIRQKNATKPPQLPSAGEWGTTMREPYEAKGADLSECGAYRYRLWRIWDAAAPGCLFVMLNPSTADASIDDRTIRRCVGFSCSFGCGSLVVVNLFAFRATNPKDMLAERDPIGPQNDQAIMNAARSISGPVICAWGAHGGYRKRDRAVLSLLNEAGVEPNALKITNAGFPGHPLYLPGSSTPTPFGLRADGYAA